MQNNHTPVSPKNQQNDDGDNFTQVPNTIRTDKRLDGNAKILLGMIASLAEKEGYCYSTNAWFAEQFDVSESTILRWLQQIESAGYTKTKYKEKTRRGTDRMIHMANYPKVKRTSSLQSVAAVVAGVEMGESKGERGSRGVTPATPSSCDTRTHSGMNTGGCQTQGGRGVNSATQLDSSSESVKESGTKTQSRIAASPPGVSTALIAEGKERIAASPPAVLRVLFESLSDADKQQWRERSEREQRLAIKWPADQPMSQRVIDARAKTLFEAAAYAADGGKTDGV